MRGACKDFLCRLHTAIRNGWRASRQYRLDHLLVVSKTVVLQHFFDALVVIELEVPLHVVCLHVVCLHVVCLHVVCC